MPRKPRGGTTGRPAFRPTDDDRKTVSLMCAVGIPHEGIALCVGDGIDDKTLRKHFQAELKTASFKADAKIGGTIFNAAVKGQAWACKLWAGRMWAKLHEHTGKDGKDIGVTVTHDLAKLDIGQLKALEAIIKAAEAE